MTYDEANILGKRCLIYNHLHHAFLNQLQVIKQGLNYI